MDIIDTLLPDQYAVYALIDPTDQTVYYVGLTRNPKRRLEQHLVARHHQGEKGDWLRRLKQIGQQPLMQILEVVMGEEAALEKERQWIRYFLERKLPLLNIQAQPRRKKLRLPFAEVRYIRTLIAGAPPIVAVRLPNGTLGAMVRSLCSLLGIHLTGQLQRIRRNPLLADALQAAVISTPGGPQQVEVLLNWAIAIWAAWLQINQLSEARQSAARVLQREVFTAIEQAFTQSGNSITHEDNFRWEA